MTWVRRVERKQSGEQRGRRGFKTSGVGEHAGTGAGTVQGMEMTMQSPGPLGDLDQGPKWDRDADVGADVDGDGDADPKRWLLGRNLSLKKSWMPARSWPEGPNGAPTAKVEVAT